MNVVIESRQNIFNALQLKSYLIVSKKKVVKSQQEQQKKIHQNTKKNLRNDQYQGLSNLSILCESVTISVLSQLLDEIELAKIIDLAQGWANYGQTNKLFATLEQPYLHCITTLEGTYCCDQLIFFREKLTRNIVVETNLLIPSRYPCG